MTMYRAVPLAAFALAVAACGGKPEEKRPAGPPPTVISVTKAEIATLEVTEDSVGTLENAVDTRIGAEIAGRVVKINVSQGQAVKRGEVIAEIDSVDQEIQTRADGAEIGRLSELLSQQERIVQRQTQLVQQSFISQNALDDATAQRNALREQLAAARARAEAGRSALRKTRILSPIDGRVEQRIASSGDYVKVGDPLFRLVGTQALIAHLPYPESASPRIKAGLPVRLSSPLVAGKVIEARISEVRPTITATNRALDAIVKFTTDGSLVGGGTVNAQVVTGVRRDVVVVHEQSVVLRPAGRVVFVIEDGKALQRVVETGYRKGSQVEVTKGLSGGETLALDGAGFLTNNTTVTTGQARGAKGSGAKGSGGKGSRGEESGGKGPGGKGAGPAGKPAADENGAARAAPSGQQPPAAPKGNRP